MVEIVKKKNRFVFSLIFFKDYRLTLSATLVSDTEIDDRGIFF